MQKIILSILILLSSKAFSSEREISIIDVELGKRFPLKPVLEKIPLPRYGYIYFKVVEPSDSDITQFYDYEIRATNPELLVYSVEASRAYSSKDKCDSEIINLHKIFKHNQKYTDRKIGLNSYSSKNGENNVRISCLTQAGSPSWELQLKIYNVDLSTKWEG